jgi:large subunit ribosomal protein L28
MSFMCDICGKKPLRGNKVVRRGKAKKDGGVGLKTTGISRVFRKPNLRRIQVVDAKGSVRRAKVCMACIRSGKVKKAV